MFLTQREKQILTILLDAPSGVKVNEFTELLQVSRRTVYRELANLETTLSPTDVLLINQRGKGYYLEGEDENLELVRQVIQVKPPTEDMSIQARQRALSLRLVLSDNELTMEELAEELTVSVSTIQNDLNDIEEELSRFGLYIQRVKFEGIKVFASERQRREIASRIIYGSVDDYDFFQYLAELEEDEQTEADNYFLKCISPQAFYLAKEAIGHDSNHQFSEVTDNQLQHVLSILALTIDRIQGGYSIGESITAKKISRDMIYLAHEVLGFISSKLMLAIDMDERHFIAQQLEGLNYKTTQSIFFESFDSQLTYRVKELIRVVSEHTGNDFRLDDTLFYDLVAHIQATLKRSVLLDYKLDTPVLQRINEEYPNIATAAELAWQEVFPDHSLTNDEQAYIVIHFATSLERYPNRKRAINAIVISSSGVGTGKILESRIKRYLPEINQVKVVQVSRLHLVDFTNYQLILSTLYLSGMNQPYRVISPLLNETEIEAIREDIHNLAPQAELTQVQTDIHDFAYYYNYYHDAKIILDQFNVFQIDAQASIEETLSQIIARIGNHIIENAVEVTAHVLQRYSEAPIGVPKSHLALFHSSNRWVKQAYFSIYELSDSFALLGMDGEEINIRRILLMIAPEPMNAIQQKILGIISSSVIESDVNTAIYESGSYSEIYQLISSLIVKESQHLH